MKKQRALVLSGGGALGAFQVGALGPLAATCDGWDMVCGVSVGAINAAKLCQLPRSQHREAVADLMRLWTTAIESSRSIYKRWTWGLLDALLAKGSLYNTEPLHALLRRELNVERLRDSGVAFRVGAVSLGRGLFQMVTEQNDDLDQWLLASSAFPVAFPPIRIGSELWIDGGVRTITPLATAALHCDEIDVVVCQPIDGSIDRWDIAKGSSVLEVAGRCAGIMAAELAKGDFDEVRHALAGRKVRIVAPKEPLRFDPLAFERTPIQQMIALGHAAATRVIDG